MAYDGQPSPFLLQAAFDACKTLALVEDAATGEIREFPLAQVHDVVTPMTEINFLCALAGHANFATIGSMERIDSTCTNLP